MNKVMTFKADGYWYNAVAWVWEPRGVIEPRTVSILITHSAFHLSGHGVAICAREDEFDIRVGVPLALKRALSQIKKVNRKSVTRAFFQQWKEAHPDYRTQPDKKEALFLAAKRRAEAVLSAVEESTPEKKGRFIVGGLGAVPISAPGEFPTWQAWKDATHAHTKACASRRPFLGYVGCPCPLAEKIRKSKWYQ